MLNNFLCIIASFLIGLLLGIERERSRPEGYQAIGVRTFVLFALLGTTTAILKQSVITATTSIFVFAIILASFYQRASRNKAVSGITTELAAGIVYILGYMLPAAPLITVTISALVLFVLLERKRLHVFSRHKIIPQEIEAIILITILSVGILPILPDKTIDPWGFFNPYKFMSLILIIIIMQFIGYIAVRLIGQRIGRAMLGFFGGLVSSTAVFATLPQLIGKKEKQFWATQSTAILSITATLVEVYVIIFIAAPKLLPIMQWPLLVMILSSIAIAVYLLRFQKVNLDEYKLSSIVPVDFISLMKTTLLIAFIFLMLALTKNYLSTAGIFITSFLSGLFELHGVTLATALLYSEKQLSVSSASIIISIAIFASFISKYILLWTLTPRRFALYNTLCLTLIWFAGGLVLFLIGRS